MACQIKRNSEGKIEQVLAPNGNDSILYSSLVNSMVDPTFKQNVLNDGYVSSIVDTEYIKDISNEEVALAAWSKAYTANFIDTFGDWKDSKLSNTDSNGEPLVNTLFQTNSNILEVKPGVVELFEDNPELYIKIYEALKYAYTVEVNPSNLYEGGLITPDGKDYLTYRVNLDKDGRKYITDLSKGRKSSDKDIGKYAFYKFLIDHKGEEITTDPKLSAAGERLLQKLEEEGYTFKTDAVVIDTHMSSAGYHVNTYNKPLYEFTGKVPDSYLSPEQNLKLYKLYSQYLDTVFPDSKVKDIVYHGITSRLKDKFEKFSKEFINTGQGRYGEEGFFFSDSKKEVNKNYNSSGLIAALINLTSTNTDIYKDTWKEIIEYITTPQEIYGGKTDLDYLSQGYRATVWDKEGDWKKQIAKLKEDGWKIEETPTSFIRLGEISQQEKTYYKHLKKNLEEGTFPFNVNNSIQAIRKAKEEGLDGLIYEDVLEESSIEKHNQYVVFEPEQIHILGSKQDIQQFKEYVKTKPKIKTEDNNWTQTKNNCSKLI